MVIPIGYLNCHTNVDPKPSILVIEALAVLHLTNKQQFLGDVTSKDHIFRMLKRKTANKKNMSKKPGQFQQRHPSCIQYGCV